MRRQDKMRPVARGARVALVALWCAGMSACHESDVVPERAEVPVNTDRGSTEENGQPAILTASPYVLDSQRLAAESRKALSGDLVAADRVAMHYSLVANDNDKEELELWVRVAAENGDPGWMIALADILREQGGDRCLRAVFWLERAIAVNDVSVGVYQRRLDALRSSAECGSFIANAK